MPCHKTMYHKLENLGHTCSTGPAIDGVSVLSPLQEGVLLLPTKEVTGAASLPLGAQVVPQLLSIICTSTRQIHSRKALSISEKQTSLQMNVWQTAMHQNRRRKPLARLNCTD